MEQSSFQLQLGESTTNFFIGMSSHSFQQTASSITGLSALYFTTMCMEADPRNAKRALKCPWKDD
jgi:hypothetical protein